MIRKLIFTVILFLTWKCIFAQDTLYKINHDKLIVTVQEVDPEVVKYKLFSAASGPLYVVNKSQLEKIVYSDGRVENYGRGSIEYPPVKGKLMLGINTFDMMFGFATINTEYYFPKCGIAIKLPVSIGINGVQGKTSPGGYNDYYYYNKFKKFTAGLGLLFYPGHLSHTVNYFTGFSFEVGQTTNRGYYYDIYPLPYPTEKDVITWGGTGIVNGVLIKLSDRVNLGLDATVGMMVINHSLNKGQVNYERMGRMDISFGFRIGK